jgi:predicted small secreted protein
MKALYLMFALLLGTSFLTACNTTAGIGKDIEHVGETIEDAAEDTHDEIHD